MHVRVYVCVRVWFGYKDGLFFFSKNISLKMLLNGTEPVTQISRPRRMTPPQMTQHPWCLKNKESYEEQNSVSLASEDPLLVI